MNVKVAFRDALPYRFQVPIKFWAKWLRGTLEVELLAVGALVGQSGLAVDIGANRGVYSYFLFRKGLQVRCFEPNIDCFKVLSGWARDKNELEIYNVALSDCPGVSVLHVPLGASGIAHDAAGSLYLRDAKNVKTINVETRSLDSYNFDSVDLLKIDVEGFESRVLSGAVVTIKKSKPIIIVEIEERHGGSCAFDVIDKIKQLGYEAFAIHDYRPRNLDEWIGYEGSKNVYRVPEGVNNFIFLCRKRLGDMVYNDFLSNDIGRLGQWSMLPFR